MHCVSSDAAALCLTNLRKTFKYGGRKDVPLREEVMALAVSYLVSIVLSIVCTVFSKHLFTFTRHFYLFTLFFLI